jgi:hypothetical protein
MRSGGNRMAKCSKKKMGTPVNFLTLASDQEALLRRGEELGIPSFATNYTRRAARIQRTAAEGRPRTLDSGIRIPADVVKRCATLASDVVYLSHPPLWDPALWWDQVTREQTAQLVYHLQFWVGCGHSVVERLHAEPGFAVPKPDVLGDLGAPSAHAVAVQCGTDVLSSIERVIDPDAHRSRKEGNARFEFDKRKVTTKWDTVSHSLIVDGSLESCAGIGLEVLVKEIDRETTDFRRAFSHGGGLTLWMEKWIAEYFGPRKGGRKPKWDELVAHADQRQKKDPKLTDPDVCREFKRLNRLPTDVDTLTKALKDARSYRRKHRKS